MVLVCPRCHTPLSERGGSLLCTGCSRSFPVEGGIADFSEGSYYDAFEGPETLTPEHLHGLSNESEGARIEGFYLPLLRRLSAGREPLRILDSGCGNGEAVDLLNASG